MFLNQVISSDIGDTYLGLRVADSFWKLNRSGDLLNVAPCVQSKLEKNALKNRFVGHSELISISNGNKLPFTMKGAISYAFVQNPFINAGNVLLISYGIKSLKNSN